MAGQGLRGSVLAALSYLTLQSDRWFVRWVLLLAVGTSPFWWKQAIDVILRVGETRVSLGSIALIAAALTLLALLVRSLGRSLSPTPEPPWANYIEDTFFGVLWRWQWMTVADTAMPKQLHCRCPKCLMTLEVRDFTKYPSHTEISDGQPVRGRILWTGRPSLFLDCDDCRTSYRVDDVGSWDELQRMVLKKIDQKINQYLLRNTVSRD